VPGNFVSYVGADPALIVQRSGHDLRFMIEPDDPRLAECLAPLRNLLGRDFQPLSRIVVETINGAAAAESAYKEALSTQFEVVRDVDHLVLLGR